jgi:hypothetical protein
MYLIDYDRYAQEMAEYLSGKAKKVLDAFYERMQAKPQQ